ncbi:MAG: YCF48-related protein [Ignavibacteria bacterium]
MKKIVIFFFLLILSCSIIYSQSGWYGIANTNTGSVYLEDMSVVNENIVYACHWANSPRIIRTTNGGYDWEIVYQSNSLLYSVCMIDSIMGFIGGRDLLLRTTNKGNNWTPINIQFNGDIKCIYFLNSNTGFLGTFNENAFKTTNSGLNWFFIGSFGDPVEAIYFIDENTGFIGTILNTYIFKTTNSGLNWNVKYSAGSAASIRCITFVNSVTGYASGHSYYSGHWGRVLKTTNSGENWVPLITNVNGTVNSVSFRDYNTGYGACDGGGIIKTTNAGVDWTLQNSFATTSHQLFRINFKSDETGYIGGFGLGTALILQTTNSGVNWIATTNGIINNYDDVFFTNNDNGYIIGANGKMLKTIDAGLNWQYITLKTNNGLNKIVFQGQSTGFVVGDNGFISRTTNAENWSQRNANTIYNLKSASFINNNTILIVGGKGTILKSTNLGDNWITMNSPSQKDLNSVFCIQNSEKVFICGDSGTILFSSNSGINFVIQNSPNNVNYNSINFYNENLGFIVGNSGVVLRTSNLGTTWNIQVLPLNSDLSSISIPDVFTSYIISANGIIYKTTNNGDSWVPQTTQTNFVFNSIFFTNINTGYIVGDGARVYKTTSGGGQFVSIFHSESNIPLSFSLHQNYPNPFNPVTKIKFDIPFSPLSFGEGLGVRLIIYNLLGKEVAQLVNEQLKPGSYEVDWDGTGFASGVYFYSLVTNDFVETKRMVLIK